MEYKTISEISEETLSSLVESDKITIDDYDYTVQEVRTIKKNIQEYIQGIPPIEENDPDREKKIFSYLYVMMSYRLSYNELYDYAATLGGYDRERFQDSMNVDIREMGKKSNNYKRNVY